MAALESNVRVFAPAWDVGRRKTTLALIATAAALAIGAAAFVRHGGDGNAARFAAQMVFRASSFAFLLYYLATPLGRLVRSRPTLLVARERVGLALAFACTHVVFLGLTVMPDYENGMRIPLATLAFAAFSMLILGVMLLGEYAGRAGAEWRPALRAMEAVGVCYFWLTFACDDLSHVYGPHRPDGFYGASLVVLVVALLARFADSFKEHYRLRVLR
jgi:hypothetical protein